MLFTLYSACRVNILGQMYLYKCPHCSTNALLVTVVYWLLTSSINVSLNKTLASLYVAIYATVDWDSFHVIFFTINVVFFLQKSTRKQCQLGACQGTFFSHWRAGIFYTHPL